MDGLELKTDNLSTSVIRDHSPYCEATGPIVQQGFVTARIRAIQEKYDAAQQGMSHSPMTPCPVPRWLRNTNHLASPNSSLASNLSKICRIPVDTTVHRGTTDVAAGSYPLHETNENETVILSPQAIPSSLAKPIVYWAPPYYGEGYSYDTINSVPKLRPRRSVADQLGSFVSTSWVGHEPFEKAYNNPPSPSASTPSHSRKRNLVCKDQSQIESSNEEALLLQRDMNTYEGTRAHNRYRKSADMVNILFDHGDTEGIQHSGQHQRCHRIRPGHRSKLREDISGLKSYKNESQKREVRRSGNDHQVALLHHPNCSEDGLNDRTEPQKLSLAREIGNHSSEWDRAGGDNVKPPQSVSMKPLTNDDYTGQPEFHVRSGGAICASPVSSTHSSHISCANTSQHSKQPATRSTSWLSKLMGYKVVLVDKAPVIRDLSRRISEPTMNSGRRQQQHQKQRRYPATVEDKAEAIGKHPEPCEQEAKAGKQKARASKIERLPETQEEPKQEEKGNEQPTGMPQRDKTPCVPGTQQYGSVVPSEISASCSDTPLSYHPLISQQLPHSCHCKGQMSARSPNICKTPTPAGIASTTVSVRGTSRERTIQFMSVHIPEENIRKSPQKYSPDIVSHAFGIQTPPRPHRNDEQSNESPQSIHWQTAGPWKGVKRVQVIVSLDEADDIVLEVKLLRRLTTESPVVRA